MKIEVLWVALYDEDQLLLLMDCSYGDRGNPHLPFRPKQLKWSALCRRQRRRDLFQTRPFRVYP